MSGSNVIGWVSGVAVSSSFQIFMVLSHSAVIILKDDRSNRISKMAASLSSVPGCRGLLIF